MVNRNDVANIFPLTPLQEGMLYRETASGGGAYIMQSRLGITGPLDADDFGRAWQMIVDRHEAFHTFIAAEGADRPLQVALKHVDIAVPLFDLTDRDEAAQTEAVERHCRKEREAGFDLTHPPLMRLALFRLSPESHLFVMTFHHIIMDGWCQGILHDELLECLRAAGGGRPPDLPEAPAFSAYVRHLSGLDNDRSLGFWRSALEGPEPGDATTWMKVTSPGGGTFDFRRRECVIDARTTSRLRKTAAESGTTLNAAFQALWGVVAGRLSGKRDLLWGTVVSGRSPEIPESGRTIGLFINTIPVRFRFGEGHTFRQAVEATGEFLRSTLSHRHVPLAEVQQACGMHGGLFDHLVIFENYPAARNGDDGEVRITAESPLHGHTEYDFVFVVDAGEAMACTLKYNAAVIREEALAILQESFVSLAEAVAATPDMPVGDIDMLPGEVTRRMLRRLPVGETLPGAETTFPAMFARQARHTPDATAVEAVDGVMTYRELDAASDAVSGALRSAAKVEPGDRVALMTGRDSTLPPAILGIMKASAVFVPLDPTYPDRRIDFILHNCACRTVIAGREHAGRFEGYGEVTVLDAATIAETAPDAGAGTSFPGPDDIAYIIHTSGSTGEPKGVMVPHRALANFIRGYIHSVVGADTPPLRTAFVANYVFDAAGRAFYPPLCRGDTVCIVDSETRLDGTALFGYLDGRDIDVLDGTPSLCGLALESDGVCDSVRRIVLGGEVLRRSLYERLRAAFPQAAVTNVYGPTETTIDSTFCRLDSLPDDDPWDVAPIGRPLPNQRVYVLDDDLRVLPAGARGEICIGGAGVASGYIGRDDLTRGVFLSDPFGSGGKLYRTGDLGYWREDGNLAILGRRDGQVKVRGHRIEIGEVETAISSAPDVTRCAVTARTDPEGHTVLQAYYTGPADARTLRTRLAGMLPGYMVPGRIVAVDTMPLTPTGKIDRNALTGGTRDTVSPGRQEPAASSPVERNVLEAMNTVLGRGGIGLHDDFFEAGGHSIAAARLVSRIAATTGKRLPVSAVYRFPTPAGLADFADRYDPSLPGLLETFHFTVNKAGTPLYCFPPYGATGSVYRELARRLNGHRFECFNYLDGVDFVPAAARLVLPEARQRPVTLLGYSGGGNLAFETAQEIERGGGRVGRVILLDSYRRLDTADIPRERHEREVRRILAGEYALLFPTQTSLRTAVANGAAYSGYLYSGMETGTIGASIVLVRADDETPDPARDRFGVPRSRTAWKELTSGTFEIMTGAGSHDGMLEGDDCDRNAAVLREILRM